jgi:NADH:ubiquinone oxidoreductase subunit 5 (subunit L)/multisubunit Na+/H+ antiporter MnhA subunit
MNHEFLLLTAIGCPVLGSVLLLPLAAAISTRLRNVLAFLLVLAALVCSLALVPMVYAGQTMELRLHTPVGMDFTLSADGLAVFMAIVSSLVSAIIVLYSADYIRPYPYQNEYYVMVVLFLGAMMGLVFSGSLILLYVFWEITAITSWRLIGFFREKQHVIRADKAFLVTVFGAVAMLLGFIMLWTQTGSLDLATIRQSFAGQYAPGLAVLLILLGILSKSATLPFHTWLPDAGVAPSPVTALLHAAVLVKIGVYVFARLFLATLTLSPFWQSAVLAIAAASALVSACAALVDTDLKRIIAYSTVSQIAFIFLGLASGSRIGIVGGLLYILMHGLAKGGLFLCAGIVEQKTHCKDIRQMGGLIHSMPLTAGAFALCAFSVMGIPPLGGFFSKYMVISGGLQGGHLGMTLVFLAGAMLTLVYLFRVFHMVFLGEAQTAVKEGSPVMVACVVALAALSLIAGLWINPSSQFALSAVAQLPGFGK